MIYQRVILPMTHGVGLVKHSSMLHHHLRATPTIMQMDLAFTKMHKTPKKTPPIVMHLDFAFYIAMHLEGETWHICQRSPAMQIEITGFSVPPRGLFSSLRAVSLRAATTSRDRRSIARPPSPASRARLDEAAHNRTTQRAIGRIYDAFLINAGQVRLLNR